MDTARILLAGATERDGDYFAGILRNYRPVSFDPTMAARSDDTAFPASPGEIDCIVFDATTGAAEGLLELKELVLRHAETPVVAIVCDGDSAAAERVLIVGAQTVLNRMAVSADSLPSAIFSAMESKRRECAVLRRAFRDDATGLSSRIYFMERLVSAFERADRTGNAFGVVFVSLGGFDRISSIYGHGVGDDLVREVSNRLKECGRASDTLARLDVDEFVVLIEDLPQDGHESGVAAVERISRKIKGTPCDINGLRIDVEIRTGLALYPLMGHTPEELLSVAGRAMHEPGPNAQVLFLH